MGTNYYLKKNICKCCNRYDELHIGKSSVGWCFSLHVIPEQGINNLDCWRSEFAAPGTEIRDEYNEPVTVDDMVNIITKRVRWAGGEPWDMEMMRQNHAEPGPNGLVRHAVSESSRCIGHGEGTYDYITGDFS
jgi:hypothetical protein